MNNVKDNKMDISWKLTIYALTILIIGCGSHSQKTENESEYSSCCEYSSSSRSSSVIRPSSNISSSNQPSSSSRNWETFISDVENIPDNGCRNVFEFKYGIDFQIYRGVDGNYSILSEIGFESQKFDANEIIDVVHDLLYEKDSSINIDAVAPSVLNICDTAALLKVIDIPGYFSISEIYENEYHQLMWFDSIYIQERDQVGNYFIYPNEYNSYLDSVSIGEFTFNSTQKDSIIDYQFGTDEMISETPGWSCDQIKPIQYLRDEMKIGFIDEMNVYRVDECIGRCVGLARRIRPMEPWCEYGYSMIYLEGYGVIHYLIGKQDLTNNILKEYITEDSKLFYKICEEIPEAKCN